MVFCFAYPSDLEQAYAFYCARYKDIEWNDFLKLGISSFMMKFNSMPESEPLYTIIKSRSMRTSEIKDKDEKRYWNKLKRINRIPDEYFSSKEILLDLSRVAKENKL
ncbi:MAG: hypothetical protein J6S85_04290 [Methanobrevibacter sp.]|nr:hypothetical protein [Methanobrevibacter sp.]